MQHLALPSKEKTSETENRQIPTRNLLPVLLPLLRYELPIRLGIEELLICSQFLHAGSTDPGQVFSHYQSERFFQLVVHAQGVLDQTQVFERARQTFLRV
jgi:hypothetical protein